MRDVLAAIAGADTPTPIGATHWTEAERLEWCVRQARNAIAALDG